MSNLVSDVIVFPAGSDKWVVYNVRARTALGVDGRALAALNDDERDEVFTVYDIGAFTNADGLLADPTRFTREVGQWQQKRKLTRIELLDLARKLSLIVDDGVSYDAKFAPKRGITDRTHFGTFHQQLGQHLILNERKDPSAWWLDQKFEPGFETLRNNLYGAVQGHGLACYFDETIRPGTRILDIGCGPGLFSAWMAQRGARVLGVDPSNDYLDVARRRPAGKGTLRLERCSVGSPGALDHLPTGSFDLVFMSDALLFYFEPAAPDQTADLRVLLADIDRLLAPQGRFVSVEPHYLFWLAPWLGAPERPFTVLAEYLDPAGFRVTPPLSRMMASFTAAGFAVTALRELEPDPSFSKTDPRAYGFACRFPLWQIYELAPVRAIMRQSGRE